ncbi:MAG: hypothetical protein ABL958_21685 [Bdellovibrionia bacterium]
MKMWIAALVLFVSTAASAAQYQIGERAYNITRSAYVMVVGLQNDGRYVLRFTTGPLAGQTGGNWANTDLARLRGCSGDLCVGENAYNIERTAYVRVVGIQYDGRFLLYYRSGPLTGQSGHNWTRPDIAPQRGCVQNYCVGDRAYNVPRNAWVTIAAIQYGQRLVLRFDTGPLAGQTGHNWSVSDLAHGL